jgi:hypothetical protein
MKQPETIFKERVFSDLKTLENAWFFKTQQQNQRGIPDIILCLRGWFIAIELKKDAKEKPDKLQLYNLNRIKKVGKGFAVVAFPENWPEVFHCLRQLELGKFRVITNDKLTIMVTQ